MLSEKDAWLYLANIIETGELEENAEGTKMCFLQISENEECNKLKCFVGYNKFLDEYHQGLCSLL